LYGDRDHRWGVAANRGPWWAGEAGQPRRLSYLQKTRPTRPRRFRPAYFSSQIVPMFTVQLSATLPHPPTLGTLLLPAKRRGTLRRAWTIWECLTSQTWSTAGQRSVVTHPHVRNTPKEPPKPPKPPKPPRVCARPYSSSTYIVGGSGRRFRRTAQTARQNSKGLGGSGSSLSRPQRTAQDESTCLRSACGDLGRFGRFGRFFW
jgi:hypothetical protein